MSTEQSEYSVLGNSTANERLLLSHITGLTPRQVNRVVDEHDTVSIKEGLGVLGVVSAVIADTWLFKQNFGVGEAFLFVPALSIAETVVYDRLRRKAKKLSKTLQRVRRGGKLY